jgi:hypothetical protein
MSELYAIPEVNLGNCSTCPNAISLNEHLEAASNIASQMVSGAFEMPIDEVGASLYEDVVLPGVSEGMTLVDPITGKEIHTPQDAQEAFRTLITSTIERQDHHVEELTENLCKLVNSCSNGPLKMRATKAGRVITATVCTSGIIPLGDSTEESVHIHRSAAKPE